MNNQELSSQPISVLEAKQKSVFGIPDEELKNYFLKEAVLLLPDNCTPNRSEREILIILYKKQKSIIEFLSQMSSIPWSLAIPNLYEVSTPYLLQDNIRLKERKQVSDELSKHLRFLSAITGKQHLAKTLFNYYRLQSVKLKKLLDTYYQDWRSEAEDTLS